jgi:hypothetical protein
MAGLLSDEELIDKLYGSDADTVEADVYRRFGLTPNLKRGTVLPIARDEQGNLTPAVPQSVIDFLKAVSLPGHVVRGGQYTPSDVTEMALNAGLLGSVATKPAGALASGLARNAAELPMDEASRMARAREQGFDAQSPLYHATTYNFSEFVPSNWRGATYLAPSSTGAIRGAAAGGMEHIALSGPTVPGAERLEGLQVIPVYVRGKIFGRDPFPEEWLPPRDISRSEWKKIRDDWQNWTPPNADQFTPRELKSLRNLRVNALDKYDTHPDYLLNLLTLSDAELEALTKATPDEPLQRGSTVARPFQYEDIEGPRGAGYRGALRKAGYSGAVVDDEAGDSIAMFDPRDIRSRFAAFDPAKKESADLLAGVAGLPGVASFLDGVNKDSRKRGISKVTK